MNTTLSPSLDFPRTPDTNNLSPSSSTIKSPSPGAVHASQGAQYFLFSSLHRFLPLAARPLHKMAAYDHDQDHDKSKLPTVSPQDDQQSSSLSDKLENDHDHDPAKLKDYDPANAEHRVGGGHSDTEEEVVRQIELESENAIKYRTCSWQKTAALLFSEYICLAIMSFPWSYSILGLVPGLILTVFIAAVVLYTSLIIW